MRKQGEEKKAQTANQSGDIIDAQRMENTSIMEIRSSFGASAHPMLEVTHEC
jgi:hypothetical protein